MIDWLNWLIDWNIRHIELILFVRSNRLFSSISIDFLFEINRFPLRKLTRDRLKNPVWKNPLRKRTHRTLQELFFRSQCANPWDISKTRKWKQKVSLCNTNIHRRMSGQKNFEIQLKINRKTRNPGNPGSFVKTWFSIGGAPNPSKLENRDLVALNLGCFYRSFFYSGFPIEALFRLIFNVFQSIEMIDFRLIFRLIFDWKTGSEKHGFRVAREWRFPVRKLVWKVSWTWDHF